MDWSRAKSILIIALIICNLVLGSVYIGQVKTETDRIESLTNDAIEYIESRGIKVSCAVPSDVDGISVITLRFKEGDSAGGISRTEYDGIPVEIVGVKSSNFIEAIQRTDIVIEILPAYTALLKCVDSISNEIDDLELIYLVDRAAYAGAGGEDTALPYWKVSSSGNSYYYAAFTE